MITHDFYGGGGLMVLGRDHHDWEDRPPHLPRKCHWALLQRQIIYPIVPYAHQHGNAFIFQGHLQFHRIATLPWPAKSLDLSPIEHLWDIPWRRDRRRPHKAQEINELVDALQEEWRQLPQATIGGSSEA